MKRRGAMRKAETSLAWSVPHLVELLENIVVLEEEKRLANTVLVLIQVELQHHLLRAILDGRRTQRLYQRNKQRA